MFSMGGFLGSTSASSASSALIDPFYSSTSLILQFEGSNGATTTTDESPIGHTITFNGNAKISTAQAADGNSSALFDGSGDYLAIADTTSLRLSNDFTIEFKFYAVSNTNTFGNLLSVQDDGYGAYGAQLLFYTSSNTIALYSSSGGAWNIAANNSLITGLSTGQWYAFALTRSGNTYSYYLDGTRIGTFTNSLTPISGHPTGIGARSGGGGGQDFDGYIDQVRITKGVARYTGASYVVPTGLFPIV